MFPQEFLESEGIEVNPPEGCPTDPYIEKRKEASALRTYKTASDFDKLRQFLEMDRKVLRFYCVWDDRDSMFGEMRKFIIHVSFFHIIMSLLQLLFMCPLSIIHVFLLHK